MKKGREVVAEAALAGAILFSGAEVVIAEEQVVAAELPMAVQVAGEVVQPSAISTFMAYNPADELGILGMTAPSSSHVGNDAIESDKTERTSDNVTTAVPAKISVPVNASPSFRPGQTTRGRFPTPSSDRASSRTQDNRPPTSPNRANK